MADSILALEQFNISGASPDLKREASYDAILHTKEYDFKIDLLVSVYEKNDFINDQATYLEIEGQFSLGDFVRFIYPERENLMITLINTVVGSRSKTEYHLLLKDVEKDVNSNMLATTSLDELNKSYTHFTAQCISKSFKHMRTKRVEGVYKKSSLYDVLSTILLKEFGLFSGLMGYVDNGLTIAPLDNTRVYDHVIIENDTPVIDVPQYLQKHKTYGLYNGGVSLFFKTGHHERLFIFPTHKDDVKIGTKELHIFGITSTAISTIESTYAMDVNVLKILVRKEARINDDDMKNRDKGTKIASVESNAIVSRPYQISKGKLELNTKWLKNFQDHKKLDKGVTPIKQTTVTGNQYALRSEVLRDNGMVIKLHWNHSNVSLLEPMMPITYYEEVNGELVTFRGILQRYDAVTDNNKRVENCILFIFVVKQDGMRSGNKVFDTLKDTFKG